MKKSSKIFISVFILLSLIPSLGILVFGQSKAAANEILSPAPRLYESDGSINTGYLNDLSDYFADTFALRQEYITAWSAINSGLLHSSVEPQVTLGRDGWLFYTSTLNDYQGNTLSDRDIYKAARNIFLMQEYVLSTGADFVFTIAPNKNSLYSEYMPSGIEKGANSNAQLLKESLNKQNVNYADMFSAFDRDELLYFATDSHWNSKGAALAADVLLASFGRSSSFYSLEATGYSAHKGDLYEMLYPAGQFTENDPLLTESFSFECASDPNGGNAISINTSSAGEGKLLCWRDSFGIALYPYLAESFGEALFSRAAPYDFTLLGEGKDCVIIELVERNIPQLISRAPILPAPERSISAGLVEAEGCTGVLSPGKTDALSTLFCLSAELPESWVDYASSVYVKCGGRYYEACLLSASDNMFAISAWLDADSTVDGIVCVKDGKLTLHAIEIQN